ncbi:DUF1850 domain-containing protein [Marinicrinis lubricantis]|uniref:DUF1850 domain-containing protein n=1 Tax=Marinicrinis lubricantis TaxID=2086470 RepID=A0ABW1IP07_9BACL
MKRNWLGALLQGNVPFAPKYGFLIVVCLVLLLLWLGRPVSAFVIQDVTEGSTIYAHVIDDSLSISHRYIHSVEKCPIIEKFEVRKEGIELTESWNCSFGAGIAYDEGSGSGSIQDGYYVIENIGKKMSELYVSPASFSDHTMTIDDETIALSEKYPYHTLQLTIQELSRLELWLK